MKRKVKKTPREINRERFTAWVKEVGGAEVGRLLECGEPHVSRIRSGARNVSGELAAKIQRLRGIPSVDWFEGSDS